MNILNIKLVNYKDSSKSQKYKILLGDIQVGKIELNHQSTENSCGWFLNIHINKGMRNKKIGMTALAYLLTVIPFTKIYANVKKSNISSIKILEHSGFIKFMTTKSGQLIYKLDYTEAIYYTNSLLSSINWCDYYPSVYTDICTFVSNYKKKNMRILILSKSNKDYTSYFIEWCESLKYTFTLSDTYMYISKNKSSDEVKSIDDSFNDHLIELGEILGYPSCCIKYMNEYSEQLIDKIEDSINKSRSYKGNEILLNIEGYREGHSLISHIPCSSRCVESYIQALLTKSFRNKVQKI